MIKVTAEQKKSVRQIPIELLISNLFDCLSNRNGK